MACGMLRTQAISAGVLAAALLQAPGSAQDQPTARVRLAAFLWHDSPNDLEALRGIRSALSDSRLSFDLSVENAGSDETSAASILESLDRDRPDLVFAMGTQAALLAKSRLRGVPMVYVAVTNPVVSGIVGDWERPEIVGTSNWIPPANVARVFRLAVPGLSRLGMLRTKRSGVVSRAELETMRAYLAEQSDFEVIEAVAEDHTGLEDAVRDLLQRGAQALWVPIDYEVYRHVDEIRHARGENRAPLVTTALQAARAGTCVGVFVDYEMLGRKTAALALALLRDGGRALPPPVVTMKGYQVVVNLSAARRAGIELPLSLLVLADELIVEEDADARR
ncbi:MAG: ABC transporter substrate-binding protein [Planctomycetota bacterium]